MHGFSLIELLFVIALMGVVLGLVGPSFGEIVQKNRIATRVNALSGDLKYARAQAITNGNPVSVCSSVDSAICSGTTDWQTGWIVFSDVNGDGAVNTEDDLLKIQTAFPGNDTFIANPNDVITYNREGSITGAAADVIWRVRNTPADARTTKCVSVNVVGRVQVYSIGGSGCS